MKIKKSVTDKVIKANGDNAKLSTGPGENGKKWSRRNALKHGILAKSLMFTNDAKKAAFRVYLDDLERDQKPSDYLERMVLEDLATSQVRRARALRLEQRLYQKSSPASQIFLKAVGGNSALFRVDDAEVSPVTGWDCQEVKLTGKRGPAENQILSSQRERDCTVQAKFSSPMDLALRYQAATRRDFYRALSQLLALQNRPGCKNDAGATKRTH